MTQPDDYFLSAANPLATVDQRIVEGLALEIVRHPDMQRARERAAYLWKAVAEYPAGGQMSRFGAMMDECALNYSLKGALDPVEPRIARILQPPGRWFGRSMPGSRWGGDNPDNAYRLAAIEHGGRYELRGRRSEGGVAYVVYALVANTATSVTLDSLEDDRIRTEADGSFVITIDAEPANGRPNHLQTRPDVKFLFVRDSLNDWGSETPNALRLRRLDVSSGRPRSLDEMARFAAGHFVDDVYLLYWFTRLNYGIPPDGMVAPRGSGGFGGVPTQMGSQGLLRLKDGEAMVITANDGGAAYWSFVLHDVWYVTLDYWSRQTSLNGGQMAPDADGRYTLVVSHEDPGVCNWVDTDGLHEHFALFRWQGIGRRGTAAPQIASKVVAFRDLDGALSPGVRRADPADRARELARRRLEFDRRFLDT